MIGSDPLIYDTRHLYRIYVIREKKKNTRYRSIIVSDIYPRVMFAVNVYEVSKPNNANTPSEASFFRYGSWRLVLKATGARREPE